MRINLADGVFDVLNGMLKESPGEVYVSEQFMATWIPAWNSSLIVPGDFRKLSQEVLERILLAHFDAINLDKSKKGKA